MLLLENSIREENLALDLRAKTLDNVLDFAIDYLLNHKNCHIDDRAKIFESLKSKDCAIGHGVAVPHVYLEEIHKPLILFIRLHHPINLDAPDQIPVKFVLVLVGPKDVAAAHLDELTDIARLFSNSDFRYQVGEAKDSTQILEAIENFYRKSWRLDEKREENPELDRTGKIFGGLIRDIKRRSGAAYRKDFTDGAHPKTLSSILFLFFACLAPAVTFGGFMGIYTEGSIGAVEMITATAICGIVFALFGGQPLIILGGTGPLLVLTMILYQLCSDLEIPFLATYAWIGLWSAVFTLILAFTDASSWVKYFTRFTDEIFAGLISVIFIYEAVRSIIKIFVDQKVSHDTALLSLLLAAGTFYIASTLSNFRRSRYLYAKVREFLADFGPTIAIACMTIVAIVLHEVELEVLPAPDSFATTSGRDWFVNPLAAPKWIWGATILPAAFVTVLIYLDQNITARLVNSPDHKLKRGAAYHLDLTIVGILVAVCSLFGLPWLVAATVRSINHVRSLATIEEHIGEGSKDEILNVRENRVSSLMIHVLIAGSLMFLSVIKNIPLAVLYGLFLYMGVVSMKGNQFFERISLWVMDPQHYPATHYLRRVPLGVTHRFTGLQLLCLVVLWVVKTSKIGILFPIFIALLAPFRILLNRFFSAHHLAALDAEEIPDEEHYRVVD